MLKTIADWSIQYLDADISVTTLSATLFLETGACPDQCRTKKISEGLRRRTPSRATTQALHSLKLNCPYANPGERSSARSSARLERQREGLKAESTWTNYARLRRDFFATARFRGVAALSMANSSSLRPCLRRAASQRGRAPRPAHVSPAGPRYFGGTLRPFMA